jgi:hypothetical protein
MSSPAVYPEPYYSNINHSLYRLRMKGFVHFLESDEALRHLKSKHCSFRHIDQKDQVIIRSDTV